MNNSEIIEKIKALLRLAKSDNPHEAERALEAAYKLASKHHVDLSQLDPDSDSRTIQPGHIPCPDKLAQEWKEALNVAHNYFHVSVTVLRGQQRCLIVGTELDIELASYVVTYLVRACRQALAKWKKSEQLARRKVTKNKTFNFVGGFFLGVRAALRKQREAETMARGEGFQLMLISEREQRDQFTQGYLGGSPKSITMPEMRIDHRARLRGFLTGSDTKINPGLKGSQPLALE